MSDSSGVSFLSGWYSDLVHDLGIARARHAVLEFRRAIIDLSRFLLKNLRIGLLLSTKACLVTLMREPLKILALETIEHIAGSCKKRLLVFLPSKKLLL